MSGGGYWLIYIRWRSKVRHRSNPHLVRYYLNIKEAICCVHMRRLLPRLLVRRHVQALCYELVIDFAYCEMRHRLCAMKCVIDFELGELRCYRSCSAAIW
ncbi:hypothetical protein AVEN_36740-1 [Araneus ventricosus]|uniref:Uncharacterized protein n=1 Tax=Araneus ventricosus TaxID=182803 RepID=A0A4Y2WIG5_ARAVE|nr:hypothetical protein AVEN_36740-1 [Araneus ventricosus]